MYMYENKGNNKGFTALMSASQEGHNAIVKTLIKEGKAYVN